MAIKFSEGENQSIVFCVVDNLNKCQSGWAKEISINLTDQFIFKSHDKFDIYIGSSIDMLLRTVCKEKYKYAVFISTGTSLKLNEKLFDEVEKLCLTNFSLAGHILDRKEFYYELHPQFFIINLKDYIKVGMPDFGSEEKIDHEQVEPIRSQENVHDDYVPLWIQKGFKNKKYLGRKDGWNIISNFLQADFKINDIGELRNYKKYLYYEYDHVFLKEISDLYYYQFFGTSFVPSHNSDKLIENINFKGPVEQYVTTGTGFNWINNLNVLQIKENTEVIFTDINQRCLEFMSLMITEWDGVDYGDFYKDFVNHYHPCGHVTIPEEYYRKASVLWKEFKLKFKDWELTWKTIKKLKYNFVLINYMGTYNLDWLDGSKKTFFNISDVFNYTPLAHTASLKYRIACENRLINSLKKINPEIFLAFSARAADGFTKNRNQIYKSKVCDFELTDINLLNKPTWHNDDWNSPVILR